MPTSDNLHKLKHFSLSFKMFFQAFWKTILAWIVLVSFVVLAINYNVDKSVIGGFVVIFGIVSQAFIGLINIIGLLPLIGPVAAKILALPLFWLINGLGYFVSLIAIKKGYSKDVVNYRILTVILLTGIVIGFVIGKLI